jgi:NADH-quinone oxidoreductase subunit E
MPVPRKTEYPAKHSYEPDPLAEPPAAALTEILDRYRGQRDALITVLEEIQEHYGYLPQRELLYAARELEFPLSQLYGAATFYNLFRFEAPGRYVVRVCKGTACHVRRADGILELLKEKLGIGEAETTADGLFTLQTVACMGACSLAPVMVVNDLTYGNMTPEQAWGALAHLREEAHVQDEEAR